MTRSGDRYSVDPFNETVTGLSYDPETGTLSITSGYVIPTTTEQANWDAAFTHISNNGSDHSFINQSVVSGASPTFGEVNIGSLGDVGTLLAVGTADTSTASSIAMAQILSSISSPTSNSLDSALAIEPYWTNNSGFMYGIDLRVKVDGLSGNISPAAVGLIGDIASVSDTSADSVVLLGLEFAASHQANWTGGTGGPLTRGTYNITGLQATSNFGWDNKTITGRLSLASPVTKGANIIANLDGTYSPTTDLRDGMVYGVFTKTSDSGIDCDVGGVDIDAYGVYIDALTEKALTGGGKLRSWGLYEANGVDSYLAGQVFFGQTDGTIGIYSQADGFLDLFADGAIRIGDSSAGAPTNYTEFSATGDIMPKGSAFLILEKASGNGIKIDQTTPTFGWRDITGEITNAGGANKPTSATYRGGIDQFQFSAGDESIIRYHIPHDYAPGTNIYLHVHWSHISAIVTGGTITFTAESCYAKGHNQAAFSAPVTGTFTGTASTTQYQHIISETQYSASSPAGLQLDTDDLEPDGVILLRLEMTTNNITSGGAVPDPFLHEVDVHYQSTNIATKAKEPDFYT